MIGSKAKVPGYANTPEYLAFMARNLRGDQSGVITDRKNIPAEMYRPDQPDVAPTGLEGMNADERAAFNAEAAARLAGKVAAFNQKPDVSMFNPAQGGTMPQVGLGAAPQAMPGREMPSAPLVNMPAPAAPSNSAAGALDANPESLMQNVDLGGQGEGGILGKIMGVLKQPGMSAALLRSAGATLNGGLGAGIQAGASFMDSRRSADQQARIAAMEYALKERGMVNTERDTTSTIGYRQGQLANAAEGNDVRRYGIDKGAETTMRGQDIGAETSRYGTDASVGNNIRSNTTSMRNTDASVGASIANNQRTVGATYASQAQSDKNSLRTLQGTMFNRGPERSVTTTTKAKPEQRNWFSPNVPAVPATSTTVRSRVPTVSSDADYKALASGSQFFAPDGTIRTKP